MKQSQEKYSDNTYTKEKSPNKKLKAFLSTVVFIILAVLSILEYMSSDAWRLSINIPFKMSQIEAYTDVPYAVVNNNVPYFTERELDNAEFELYSNLDNLGRCGTAYANISRQTMPTDARGDIGQIKPTGWHTYNYGDLVDGNYLYNRCHLIGWQLAGENANEKNLITGTRYMNVEGMLPFENMIADYVKETGNHVLYRVTPVFGGQNLLAYGVLMEAYSLEDNGEGVLFNVFCYNVQPGVIIDYVTGKTELAK